MKKLPNKKSKYLYTSHENIMWFTTPKTGTRSLHALFKECNMKFPGEKHQTLPEDHQTYFKFTFVRNPWSRILSTYQDKVVHQWSDSYPEEEHRWRIKKYMKYAGKDFKYFINNFDVNIDRHTMPQEWLFPIDKIDFIGRFENLQQDFDTICDKIGIPRQKLPHKNKTKHNHKHYTEYYDDETRQIVAEKYAKDIEYFGYEFGE